MKNKVMKSFAIGLLMLPLMSLQAHASTTAVNITAEPTALNVTVPTTFAISLKADGTAVVPSNFTIANNSKIGAVKITKIMVSAGTKGWKLVSGATSLVGRPVDTKELKLGIVDGTDKWIDPATGLVLNKVIAAESNTTLQFKVERTAFSTALDDAGAFTMETTIAYN